MRLNCEAFRQSKSPMMSLIFSRRFVSSKSRARPSERGSRASDPDEVMLPSL